jgi:hypothetical protein
LYKRAVPANSRRGFSLGGDGYRTGRDKVAVLASVELEFWEKVFIALVGRGFSLEDAVKTADEAVEERRKRQKAS